MKTEIIKTIPNYNNYECDIFGNIFSLNFNRTGERGKLKPLNDTNGYEYVSLWENGKQKNISIHRIVMSCFRGKSKLHVNHKDGNKQNNFLSNLEYCTAKENTQHAIKMGLVNNKGEKSVRSKLTKRQVIDIKFQLKNKYIYGILTRLAKKYEVTPTAIKDIKTGRTWNHI